MAEKNRLKIYKLLDGKCFYCGCKLDFDNFHLDHFIPKASNGSRENNLVPSCPECNLCKSNLSLEEFRDKLSKEIWGSFYGKLIRKYYRVKPQKVEFYFEKEHKNGTL